jgi:hypothetical protein
MGGARQNWKQRKLRSTFGVTRSEAARRRDPVLAHPVTPPAAALPLAHPSGTQSGTPDLRAGPAPLTLEALRRFADPLAAAGDSSRRGRLLDRLFVFSGKGALPPSRTMRTEGLAAPLRCGFPLDANAE